MNKINPVDDINKKTMHAAVTVYSSYDELSAPEKVALASVADRVRGKRILDLGVGGGRTVAHLRALSPDYLGVDYVQSMVDACRKKFPDARFEYADARSMPQFGDASFDLIVFAWAGLCMVDHAGRLAILKEIRRILAPNGFFIFSTYNQNSADHEQSFEFPEFDWSNNPVKLVVRGLGFLRSTAIRAVNKFRLRRYEIRGAEYSIINDRCHDYATMLYYITLENQHRQLEQAGFAKNAVAYDIEGNRIDTNTTGNSITFVASI